METKLKRFNKAVWAFTSDFTASLAKAAIRLSPYVYPEQLETALGKFEGALREMYSFDKADMTKVYLGSMTDEMYSVFQTIPEIMAWNESEEGQDFIDIYALAQNVTCDFADKAELSYFYEFVTEPLIQSTSQDYLPVVRDRFSRIVWIDDDPIAEFEGWMYTNGTNIFRLNEKSLLNRIENMKVNNHELSEEIEALRALRDAKVAGKPSDG